MFSHLFRLIWNKRKQNLILISEMLISFLVIFSVFTLLVYYFQNYRKPLGIDYENVWVANFSNSLQSKNADSLSLFYETLRQRLKSMPQVKEVSYCSANIPFAQATMQSGFTHNGKQMRSINAYQVEDGYKDVLNVKMIEGRWFVKQDAVAKDKPIIINNTLKKLLFGQENAVGKYTGGPDNKMKVIGVAEDIKVKGDYTTAGKALFNRIDTGYYQWLGNILISIRPDADAAFESKLYKAMAGQMKNANIEIEHLSNKRKSINHFSLVPMIVLLIVACFLIINVALGLFGVLWYNISKRRGEIGLRRAVGASGNSVSFQLISESLILASLSLSIGCFFAIQFPLLNVFDLPASVYIMAIVLSVMFIYMLVFICSLYPGRQAAAIPPAVALHED